MNLARHAVLFGLLLFNLSPSLRGQSGTQDKAQILKLVVVAELESSGYKPAEGVCFSTREKPAVEKELVRSLRASKLSIVQLGNCARHMTRSGIDIKSITLDDSAATVAVTTSDWDWPAGEHFFVYLRKGNYTLTKGKNGPWQIDGYSNRLKDGPRTAPADYRN